jgi:DNA phosphorothioation-dependent restriction protein DptH
MKLINAIIKEYILEQSIASFNGNNGASRLLVKGIPFNIANALVSDIIKQGGFVINDRTIPIVVFDKKINSSVTPNNDLGGICGKDHVLNLRNSISITEIIVLLSEGSSLDKSNTTSFIPIGIDEDILDEDWVYHDFIQYVISQILLRNGFTSFQNEIVKTISSVLLNYKSLRTHQGDHIDQWELLSNMSENVEQASISKLRATLGLVNEPDKDSFDADRSSEIFSRIADAFENNGVHSTITEWCQANHSDVIKTALNDFGYHFAKVCNSVSSFRISPYFYYSQEARSQNWWHHLTFDVWNEILDDAIELKGGGKIEIANSIFRNNIPCPVVFDDIHFKLVNNNLIESGASINILLKKAKYELIESLNIIDSSKEIIWKHTPKNHRTPQNYKFQIDGFKDASAKVISLKNYEPGFVFDSVQLEKASPFKKVSRKGSKNQIWNSSIVLSNSGTHEIEFYWDDLKYEFFEINFKFNISENAIEQLRPIIQENRGTVTFEVENECLVEFILKDHINQTVHSYKINVLVNESEPIGVATILDKLVFQNQSTKGLSEKIRVYSTWNKLHQIQNWIVENCIYSHYPLIIGSDFRDAFARPNWESKSAITNGEIIVDCRPIRENYTPPTELVELRNTIIDLIINGNLSNDGDFSQPLIEYKELFNDNEINKKIEKLLPQYIGEYLNWFTHDTANATWWDTIAFCDITNSVVDNEPFAILLNPFHPIRLAWQFQSQSALYDALIQKIPCPAAGVLDASKFPDSIALPCFKSEGQISYESFLSIGGSSHYWSLLWNSNKLSLLTSGDLTAIFNSDFGLQIQGLDGGLSGSQVEQTLTDIFNIKSGQNTINIEVHSDSSENEMFNDGIKSWVEKNLGEDRVVNNRKEIRDLWFSSGSRKLSVFDTRVEKHQPTSEELVDITIDSGFNLKWFSKEHPSKKANLDLTILSHLSNKSPQAISGDTSCVVFNGGLIRQRIKYSTKNTQGILTYTESRAFSTKPHKDFKNPLEKCFFEMVYAMENEVFIRKYSHLNSTPNLQFVYEKLIKSDYCAVSSSAVHPSAFFDSEGKNYLWDYDLPSYGHKQSGNSGFYLLAKSSESIMASVKKSLKTIPGMGNVSNEIVKSLLQQISGRGIPTLKTLASGGASANGEIGMLTAMSLLQGYNSESTKFELFPSKLNETINLLIPVDPFLNQISALQDALNIEKMRPDLLALSFCVANNSISNIKITPIEVKYRNSPLDRKQTINALSQCTSFRTLFDTLIEISKKSVIWDVARCQLLSDLIIFSFSVYAKRLNEINEIKNWSILQSKVLNSLNNYAAVEVCQYGRLIIISDYNSTEFENINSEHTKNVLKIAFKDAKDLLLMENLEKFSKLNKTEPNWGLVSKYSNEQKVDQTIEDRKPYSQPEKNEGYSLKSVESVSKTSGEQSNSNDINKKAQADLEQFQNEGIKFIVGHHEGALQSVSHIFHPSNTNLNQLNIGIVGDLGTGKTQLIKSLLYNLSRNPENNRGRAPKFLIMDTKRDYDGTSDNDGNKTFAQNIDANIVKPYKLPINLFDIRNSKDDHPALAKAEFYIDILKKIFSGIGPNQENAILVSVLSAFESRGYQPYQSDYSHFISPTLNDIFEEYKLQVGEKIDTPYSIMHKLVISQFFENDSSKTIDFSEFFQKSIILSLGGVASNDRNLKTLMIIFMSLYRDYMLSVKKYDFIISNEIQLRKIDSYLLIDEANLIMEYELPVLEDLLLKGREFGIGIILSSQYLSHFRKSGTNYLEPLLTWFLHKVPNISVKELQSLGLINADESLVQKIKTLEKHFCLYKGLDTPGLIIKGIPYYQIVDNKD